MEAASLFAGGVAVAAGFSAALFGAYCVQGALKRRIATASFGGSNRWRGVLAWRLRRGFPLFNPPADALLALSRARALIDEALLVCAEKGFASSRRALASTGLAAGMLLGTVAGVAASSVVAALAVEGCALAAALVALSRARDRRKDAVRDAVPDALESMAACFGSGYTLLQTFSETARAVSGPLGATFARAAHVLETGGSAEEALDELKRGSNVSELAFVAVALDVQHQSGGSMGQVLSAATETVKGELALRRALRVQTAQARLSARVVAMTPLVLVTAFSLASPGFLSPFFASVQGWALLALALLMQAAGIVLVRRSLTTAGAP